MTKVKNPLLSLGAVGRLTRAIVFARRRKVNIAEEYPEPKQPNSLLQLEWRHMYQKAVALWHALSSAEKQDWESLARPKHMTGYAYFISLALKPNPGLYLPLQGGTMSGDIIMAKNRILQLPLPADSQEPLTLAYFTANIAPFLYNERARVHHNAAQAIPHGVITIIAFNSERYDNDNIHDNVVNNSRLTCRTAGVYAIAFTNLMQANVTGTRQFSIKKNGTTYIAFTSIAATPSLECGAMVYAQTDLAVGDYVQVTCYQNSGPPLNLLAGAQYSPEFMMARIAQ